MAKSRARDVADSGIVINTLDNISTDVQLQINDRIQVTNSSSSVANASNISNGTLSEPRLPYRIDQNVRTTDNVQFNSLTLSGDLSVSGNVVTVSANNLVVTDSMIYLNANSEVTNPDVGIAANYNDGTYRHTGFFRDASDGTWKVFDKYTPEPDANVYINTSHASFNLANFQANTVTASIFCGDGSNLTGVSGATGQINYFSSTPSSSDYLPTNGQEYYVCDYPTLACCLNNKITYMNMCIPFEAQKYPQGCYPSAIEGIYWNAISFDTCGCACNTLVCCFYEYQPASMIYHMIVDDEYTTDDCIFIYGGCCCGFWISGNSSCAARPATEASGATYHSYNHSYNSYWSSGNYTYGGLNDTNSCGTVWNILFSGLSGNICHTTTSHRGVISVSYDQTNRCMIASGCLYCAANDGWFGSNNLCFGLCNIASKCAFRAQGTTCKGGCVSHVMIACELVGGIYGLVIYTSAYSGTSCCRFLQIGTCYGDVNYSRKIAVGRCSIVNVDVCGWRIVDFDTAGMPCSITCCVGSCTCQFNNIIFDYDTNNYIVSRCCSLQYSSDEGYTWNVAANTTIGTSGFYRAGNCRILAVSNCGCYLHITCDGGVTWTTCDTGKCNKCLTGCNDVATTILTKDCKYLYLGVLHYGDQRYHCLSKIRMCDLVVFTYPKMMNMTYDSTSNVYIGAEWDGTNPATIYCSQDPNEYPWICKGTIPTSVIPLFNVSCREIYTMCHDGTGYLSYNYASYDCLESVTCSTPVKILRNSCATNIACCCGCNRCFYRHSIGDCFTGRLGVIALDTDINSTFGQIYYTADKGNTWVNRNEKQGKLNFANERFIYCGPLKLISCCQCSCFAGCYIQNELQLFSWYGTCCAPSYNYSAITMKWDKNANVIVLDHTISSQDPKPYSMCNSYPVVGTYWDSGTNNFVPVVSQNWGANCTSDCNPLTNGFQYIDNSTGETYTAGMACTFCCNTKGPTLSIPAAECACAFCVYNSFGLFHAIDNNINAETYRIKCCSLYTAFCVFRACGSGTDYNCGLPMIVNGRAFYGGNPNVVKLSDSTTFKVPNCPGGWIKT